jgi:DNA repair exonuclease SbcCD ATPase subunit
VEKAQIEKSIASVELELLENRRSLRQHEQAREILREAGLKTQESLSFHIAEITSLAQEVVFDKPYTLGINFVNRRNTTECDLFFIRDGEQTDPIEDSGGGPLDVAAFSLRVASWCMENPISNNVLILDEPFKHLKGETANLRVLDMVQQISKKLNLQIIMVSDERISRDDIEEKADRLFLVELKNKVSQVTVIK